MWAVGVVVLDVLVQDGREVALSGDQQVVEAFAAQGALVAQGHGDLDNTALLKLVEELSGRRAH